MRSHEAKATVRFGDCDPAGVIFYPRAFELAHAAVEDFIRAAYAWDLWFASSRHAFPIRTAQADFLAPMTPGEGYRVMVAVEKIGTTSVAFAVEFADASGRATARVRTVHVALDRATGQATAIPREIRAVLDRGMSGARTE